MPSLPPVLLGLGSNLGDREANLARARRRLGERGFRILRESALYETEPVGGPPQGPFLNQVVAGETALDPHRLLAACLEIERELGRVRAVKDGPRSIDLDLLFFGDRVLDTPQLVLPHPRLHLRRFVLAPLAEIAPELSHPRLRASAAELLRRCADTAQVRPLAARP
jgi:2-amino-4-hydroxy-6-hydroxymethyldihydropteridine diphosphokinase